MLTFRVMKPAKLAALVLVSLSLSLSPAGASEAGPALPTASVLIREFMLPTPAAFPHDPAVGRDGSLWVTEQKANRLAQFDPVTQIFREFTLPTPDSGPHGIAVDKGNFVWFTANQKAYIGRLDPSSGVVAVYPMPTSKLSDPHSLVLAPDGTIWFTAEQSNFVGHLFPNTGQIVVRELPRPHALPYGLVIGGDGAPYLCEFGTNRIARVNPDTLELHEFNLPDGAMPRRIATAPDGKLFYTDFARGKIGRLDPTTNQLVEWSSPGGSGSQPYAITVDPLGQVWFSESGVRPNTLIHFDPDTQRFARVNLPAGGGVVRNMTATADGRLYIAESGVDRVAIVTPLAEHVAKM